MKSASVDSGSIPDGCTMIVVEDKGTAKCVILDSEDNVKKVFEVQGDKIDKAKGNMKFAVGAVQEKGIAAEVKQAVPIAAKEASKVAENTLPGINWAAAASVKLSGDIMGDDNITKGKSSYDVDKGKESVSGENPFAKRSNTEKTVEDIIELKPLNVKQAVNEVNEELKNSGGGMLETMKMKDLFTGTGIMNVFGINITVDDVSMLGLNRVVGDINLKSAQKGGMLIVKETGNLFDLLPAVQGINIATSFTRDSLVSIGRKLDLGGANLISLDKWGERVGMVGGIALTGNFSNIVKVVEGEAGLKFLGKEMAKEVTVGIGLVGLGEGADAGLKLTVKDGGERKAVTEVLYAGAFKAMKYGGEAGAALEAEAIKTKAGELGQKEMALNAEKATLAGNEKELTTQGGSNVRTEQMGQGTGRIAETGELRPTAAVEQRTIKGLLPAEGETTQGKTSADRNGIVANKEGTGDYRSIAEEISAGVKDSRTTIDRNRDTVNRNEERCSRSENVSESSQRGAGSDREISELFRGADQEKGIGGNYFGTNEKINRAGNTVSGGEDRVNRVEDTVNKSGAKTDIIGREVRYTNGAIETGRQTVSKLETEVSAIKSELSLLETKLTLFTGLEKAGSIKNPKASVDESDLNVGLASVRESGQKTTVNKNVHWGSVTKVVQDTIWGGMKPLGGDNGSVSFSSLAFGAIASGLAVATAGYFGLGNNEGRVTTTANTASASFSQSLSGNPVVNMAVNSTAVQPQTGSNHQQTGANNLIIATDEKQAQAVVDSKAAAVKVTELTKDNLASPVKDGVLQKNISGMMPDLKQTADNECAAQISNDKIKIESYKDKIASLTGDGHTLTKAEQKQIKNYTVIVKDTTANVEQMQTIKAWFDNPKMTNDEKAYAIAQRSCNMQSYYLYGKATGQIRDSTTFGQFYKAALQNGEVGMESKGVPAYNFGSGTMDKQLHLTRENVDADTTGVDLRNDLNDSGAKVAIIQQNSHFFLITKADDNSGNWINQDQAHINNRSVAVNWNATNIQRIIYMP